MKPGWCKGTPVLVRTTVGGLVGCSLLTYEREGFWLVRVNEGPQVGRQMIVHEDDATRDEQAAAC